MTRTVLLVTICAISSVKSLYPCFTQQYRAGNCDFFCQLKCSNTGTCSHYLGYQVGSCNSNQVFLNGLCYSTSSDFGPCQFSEQCTGAGRCAKRVYVLHMYRLAQNALQIRFCATIFAGALFHMENDVSLTSSVVRRVAAPEP
ncbi:hypothetical protein L596_010964 [Steinernema carpocapsae]|uniref:EB domain-containing protein n=1 Tax=Steinernema carpocapsae TaxID=34508 RepID=A0A4U5NRN2_STECR|nr:hypothetical protein L596_010964 [Steinernema carpocapsae]